MYHATPKFWSLMDFLQSNPLIKYTLLFWLATNIVTDLKVENCANLTFIMVETKLETWICT